MESDIENIKKSKYLKFEFAVEEDPNLGIRKSMEDYTIADSDLLGDASFAFFCVLDGHGGNEVSKYLKENYPKFLKQKLELYRNAYTIANIIKMSIDNIEKQLQTIGGWDCGSTFCGLLFDLKNRRLWAINVGDSRAIRIRFLQGHKIDIDSLTVDHKTTNQDEVKRIEKIGGSIINGRLAGNLLITRSLGDFDFKKYGLISIPDIEEYEIQNNEVFLIASDGIWDVISKEELKKNYFDMFTGNLKQFSKKLCSQAVKIGSTDNISMVVIKT